jgi:hypothetical protein
MVRGAWCMVRGAWCVVRGAWCMVHGAWCMVHGAWCMVRGAWCMVRGAWCMVRGAWCVVRGESISARCLAPLHGYRVGERSWTCIATGVDLGMAVVAAEVFVLRHLVRYLHGAHTRVCASVCVCVDAAHGISSVRAYATHPVHSRLISWRMEGGSGGRLRGAVGAMGAMRAQRYEPSQRVLQTELVAWRGWLLASFKP